VSAAVTLASLSRARLGARAFDVLRRVIHARSGISLNDSKVALVESRLARRLRALDLDSYDDYARIVEQAGADDEETREMLNCITTNKTSFFREPHHFALLTRTIVPQLVERARATGTKRIRIWSAGCSTGQEPYSIAMTLREALGSLDGWDVRILASDIDTTVLETAANATYRRVEMADVPPHLREAAFERTPEGARVVRELRDLVTFRRINLVAAPWPIHTQFDVVFCRNVGIYFDRETQRGVYRAMADVMAPEAYLVAGHSENLFWLSDLFRPAGGTVYRPAGAKDAQAVARPPPEPRIPDIAIHSGAWHATAEPTRIRTVLGSCVAACLYDPVARVGGMNHFMLPDGQSDSLPARFGVHAMDVLIGALMKLGAQRHRLVAKIFGGANIVAALRGESNVAVRNVEFIERFLADESIPVAARKLGGEDALLVHFETGTGIARVRAVERSQSERVAVRERTSAPSSRELQVSPGVTFF
jgi:chemotaxis protein methyltransferase CheR